MVVVVMTMMMMNVPSPLGRPQQQLLRGVQRHWIAPDTSWQGGELPEAEGKTASRRGLVSGS